MADGDSEARLFSRRAILAATAGAGAAGLAAGISGDGQGGTLYGGTMALSQEYNVAGDLWIGPDSAKSNVSADSGRVYHATDTQVEYYGDSGSWTKLGVGSSSQPVPSVTTEQAAVNTEVIRAFGPEGDFYTDYKVSDYADLGDALSTAASELFGSHSYGKTGGTIVIPTQLSAVSNSATLEDGVVFQGTSIRASTIEAASGMTDPVVQHAPTDTNNKDLFQGIRNLRVDGNNENCKGINLDSTTQTSSDTDIYDVIIRDTGGRALDTTGNAWGLRVERLLVEGCGANATHCIMSHGQEQYWEDLFVAYNDATYALTTWGTTGANTRKTYDNLTLYENEENGALVRDGNQVFNEIHVENNGQASSGTYDGVILGTSGSPDADYTKFNGGTFDGKSQTDRGLVINASNVKVLGATFKNHVTRDVDVANGDSNLLQGRFETGIRVQSGVTDTRIVDPQLTWSDVTDNGTRTTLNGVGLNSGDPSSTGDWNGNGVEGVRVRDTSNSNTYIYNNGSWSQIASA